MRGKIIFCVLVANIGGFMFGYELGVITGMLPKIVEDFHLGEIGEGCIVGGAAIGQLLGSIIGGYLADLKGRKYGMYAQCFLFIAGIILGSVSGSLAQLTIARIIIGIGSACGILSNASWISEVTPEHQRGRAVASYELSVTLGFLLAICVNLATDDWRVPFLFCATFPCAQLCGLYFVPESPVWYAMNGMEKELEETIAAIDGTSEELRRAKRVAGGRTHLVLDSWKSWWIPLLVVFVVQALSSLSGGVNIRIYAERILQDVGASRDAIVMYGVWFGLVKVLSTCGAVCFLDTYGRRVFYLMGLTVMLLANILIGLGSLVCYDQEYCRNAKDQLDCSDQRDLEWCPASCSVCPQSAQALVGTGCILGFIAYQLSFGPVNYALGTELFPGKNRGRFMGAQIVCQGIFQLVTASTFPIFSSYAGLASVVGLQCLFCVAGAAFIVILVPETAKRDPDDIRRRLQAMWAA